MNENKITIKSSKADKDIRNQKNKLDVKLRVEDFIQDRDKNNRGLIEKNEDTSAILEAEIEIKEKLYEDSLIEKEFPENIKPMFNSIFITAKRNKIRTESGILLPTASIDEDSLEFEYQLKQTVVSVGPQTQQVEIGDEVVVVMSNFKKMLSDSMASKVTKKYKFELPKVDIDGVEYLKISERDVDYIVKKK